MGGVNSGVEGRGEGAVAPHERGNACYSGLEVGNRLGQFEFRGVGFAADHLFL